METFTTELFFIASANLFPDNTLSSFENVLPEQLNLEGHGEVKIRTYPTHHFSKMSQRENFCFLTQSFQTVLNSFIGNPVSTIHLPKVLKPRTRSFKKDTIKQQLLFQSKCLEEGKKRNSPRK